MERRSFLTSAAALGAGSLATAMAQDSPAAPPKRTSKLKQAVTNGAMGGAFAAGAADELEKNCKLAASLGFKGYDFINPDGWPILKKYGLVPSMMYAVARTGGGRAGATAARGGAQGAGAPGAAPAAGEGRGGGAGRGPAQPPQPSGMQLNNPEHHAEQEKLLHAAIDQAAANGVPSIIVFSGSRATSSMGEEQAAENCAAILNRVKAHAEDKAINLSMEYLSNAGYFLSKMPWGVGVMQRVNSPRVGVLYDIWHAQVVEGNVVNVIRNNIKWINHIHTAGNPGRNQLDDNQELNYRFIARAVADLNFEGYVAHEYRPSQGADPVACLKQAFEIFNI